MLSSTFQAVFVFSSASYLASKQKMRKLERAPIKRLYMLLASKKTLGSRKNCFLKLAFCGEKANKLCYFINFLGKCFHRSEKASKLMKILKIPSKSYIYNQWNKKRKGSTSLLFVLGKNLNPKCLRNFSK